MRTKNKVFQFCQQNAKRKSLKALWGQTSCEQFPAVTRLWSEAFTFAIHRSVNQLARAAFGPASLRNNKETNVFGDFFFSLELTWFVVPVKDGESEEGSVAVGGEGRLGQGRQVVHVEEAGAVCVVVAGQQQVHVIGSLTGRKRRQTREDWRLDLESSCCCCCFSGCVGCTPSL